jgi:hypothetical protein
VLEVSAEAGMRLVAVLPHLELQVTHPIAIFQDLSIDMRQVQIKMILLQELVDVVSPTVLALHIRQSLFIFLKGLGGWTGVLRSKSNCQKLVISGNCNHFGESAEQSYLVVEFTDFQSHHL